MAVQTWWRDKVVEVKGAFRSVQTPSEPFEEVISTFGEFLMKADSQSGGGRCWRAR